MSWFSFVSSILFISLSSVMSELREETAWHRRLRRQGLNLVLGLPSDCPQTAPGQVPRQVAEGGAFMPVCHLLAVWALGWWRNFSRPRCPCVWDSGHHSSPHHRCLGGEVRTLHVGMMWNTLNCLLPSKPFIDVFHAEGSFEDPFST